MEKQNAFFYALQLMRHLDEGQKKQLAIILMGQTLNKLAEEQTHEISRLNR
jgi:hypothetical protein